MMITGYKLMSKQRQLFHFGETNLDTTSYVLASDSLFSALVFSYLHHESEFQKRNELFEELKNSIFSLSSLYFGIKHNEYETYFISMPKNFKISKQLFEEDSKFLKKCEFISLRVLELWNKEGSEGITSSNVVKIQNSMCLVTRNEFNELNLEENQELFYEMNESKVQLVKDADNELFKIESFMFNPKLNMFFYFLIDSNSKDIIEKSLSQLCISYGLGGDISVGKGSIESFGEFSLNVSESGNFKLSLGKYVPEQEDLSFLDESYYSISSRKGYVFANSHKRKDCFCFDEGSVFDNISDKGSILDVTPENFNAHRVFKFFKPIMIPIEGGDKK